jgi:hypothetical protein
MSIRNLGLMALGVAAIAAGRWFGEGLDASMVSLSEAGTLLLLIALTLATARQGRTRLIAAVVVTLLFIGADAWGRRDSQAAFNDCVAKGEAVRQALARYRSENGHFPDELSALSDLGVGRRMLRRDLLSYRRVGDGYALSFGDRLVTFTASEAQPFSAHK